MGLAMSLSLTRCSCWRSEKSSPQAAGKKVSVQAKKKDPNARLYYKFIPGKEADWLAQSDSIKVTHPEVEALTFYRGVEQKRKEILFALIYQQYVAYEKNPPKKLELLLGPVGRSVRSLLNQFGLPCREETKVVLEEKETSKTLARVEAKVIKESDLNQKSYLWGRLETLMFQARLKGIDKIIKEKRVLREAREQGVNVQDYLEDFVYKSLPKKMDSREIEKARQARNFPKNEEGLKKAKAWLKKQRRQKHYDYFLEKYLLDLPIQVRLEPPQFDLQIESEYVAAFGEEASEVEVTLFTDHKNARSLSLASKISKLFEDYDGLRLELRPIIASQNSYHLLHNKVDYCVWRLSPESFLSYFNQTRESYSVQTHEKLFQAIGALNLSQEKILDCVQSDQALAMIDYHQKYARYLGIYSGPVVFVSGEVLGPQADLREIKAVINRKLQVPDAGTWD